MVDEEFMWKNKLNCWFIQKQRTAITSLKDFQENKIHEIQNHI